MTAGIVPERPDPVAPLSASPLETLYCFVERSSAHGEQVQNVE
jgi:hypothetical protein